MKQIFIVLVGSLLLICCGRNVSVQTDNEPSESVMTTSDSISLAIDNYMQRYQGMQYRDIYKYFMQDFFGPGHILNDTVAAGRYLRSELAETDRFDGPDYEST